MEYILYQNRAYKQVSISIRPDAEFNDILLILNSLEFKECKQNEEQIIFAILELLNNSLRAHREKNIYECIRLIFRAEKKKLYISISDWGGGFDPNRLPYSIDEEPDNIDTNNEVFHQYRAKFNYLRFGIGLYVVKKTFSTFDLYFIDKQKQRVTWESGQAAGTCVELSIGTNNE